MKFTAAVVLAAAAGASAHAHGNATVVTEVVESYVTYCPGPTEITHGSQTYTVTEATTLTITDCPCTITKPVITTSAVVCHDCEAGPSSAPVPVPSYPAGGNSTIVTVPHQPSAPAPSAPGVPPPAPTGDVPPPASTPPASGAGKAMAVSGAGLAGLLALAAFL